MTRKKKSSDRYEPEELKRLLHSYWLVSEYGIMAAGIEQVVMAYFEGKRIVLVLQKSTHAEPIVNTLVTLGLHYGDETVNSYRELRAFTHSTKGLSNNVAILKVPTLADRVEDFELLLPFAYERALRELNSELGQRIVSIEGGFILSALVLLKFGRYGLREIVRNTIGCKEDGVIWGARKLGIQADKMEVSEFIRDIPPAAGAYLGLGRKGSHAERYPRNAEELYPAHEMKQEFLSLANGDIDDPTFLYPRLPCAVRIEPESLGMLAANFAYWYCRPDRSPNNPSLYVLKLRLWACTEDEIHRAVIDGDKAEYEDSLAKNNIGLASRESRDVLREWEQARDRLFGGAEAGALEFPVINKSRPEKISKTQDDTITLDKMTKKAAMRLAAKPKIVIDTKQNTIAVNDRKPQSYPRMAILAAAWALEYHQNNSSSAGQQSYFVLKELQQYLAGTDGRYKSKKIKDIFRGSPLYPSNSNTKLVIFDKTRNKYYLDIDVEKSRIEA